jgi:tRNA dimethylallyltransferase
MNKKIHIVFGPTASGKTDYAVQLAHKFDSVIINGDSMQIYKEIPIITNQPIEAEKQGIPHLMFGYKSILDHSDLNIWLNETVSVIKENIEKNKVCIVSGGTGMYLKALFDGISEIPIVPEKVKNKNRDLIKEIGNDEFYNLLTGKDPEIANKLKIGDAQRLCRAMDVIDFTGISILQWHKKPNKKFFDKELFEIHFLDKPREEIYNKINKRFEKFVEIGALDEAKKANEIFRSSGFSKEKIEALPAYKAHGLRELISYLNGEITLEEAINKGQQVTRNYAKRQITWWKGQIIA